jgi:hypothetical protein
VPPAEEPHDATGAEPPDPGAAERVLRRWVWPLAFAAQALVLLWIVRSEITARVFLSSWTLSLPGVVLLLALLAANAARRGRAFTRAELVGIYVAVSSTATLAGYNFFQLLIPTLAFGRYYGASRGWGAILQYVPSWLLPSDRDALLGLLRGNSPVLWIDWIGPLAAWGSLVLALTWGGLALNGLLADTWIERERLAFPIAALPLEMTRSDSPLWKSRVFWAAFALPVALNTLLALAYYYPSLPAPAHKHQDLLLTTTTPPLSLLRPLYVGYTPFAIGLAYLAPTDVSFSIWIFQWLAKGQRLLAYQLGYLDPAAADSPAPYLNEQTVGAFVVLAFVAVWRALPRRRSAAEVADRPLNRLLVAALTVCLGYVLCFLLAAGFSLPLALGLIALYFVVAIVLSRVRSEAGFAWAYGPDRFSASLPHVVINTVGTGSLTPRGLALMSVFHWVWWDMRFSPVPAQMDALRLGHGVVRRRQLLALMAAAALVAVVVGLAAVLQDSYRFGWETAQTYEGPRSGARGAYALGLSWLNNRTQPRWDRTAWTLLGGLVTGVLAFLRQRFTSWPLHPIGYAMAGTATSNVFWGHYFIAWVAKCFVLRYGGIGAYRASLPLAFGLILGDVASQTLWSLAGTLLDLPVYQFVS